MTMKQFLIVLCLCAPQLAQATAPAPANSDDHRATAHLSAEQARRMATAAEQAALAHGHAIVDNHGNLKHFHRMDGTSSGSVQVAQLKASTSARFPASSRSLGERSAALPANPYASLPGFLLLEGGLPIMDAKGAHIGGIGISGATPELDAQFAQAALDAS
ncbi:MULTISPECIES: heme-binding protein [unclassified Pseudomonas]|uniref:GlcG/HbpS family heme-binding protein n=1 Tax=unclassified Pseudomonas TaxID=196821 RepID=UPI002446F13A|nr:MULTISPECIES: heme-binding protein [unclassified Pseudomonas]MDH0303791.1 heme-binding protein [Pseudomonas sp. GD04091]MDH1987412.1 heme-binding protein [Pseudomonas sp. GD03689]